MLKLLDRAAIILATATAFGIAVLPLAAHAESLAMPTGCVDAEYYFDAMEYNESAEWLGRFGADTGMGAEGELVRVDGVTYDVRFYDDAICINQAEPHTKYNVTKQQ